MATNMPVKLLLRDTSSISLNERFEKLPKHQPKDNQQNANRQERIQNQQASVKNRRLAAQMANRPSVQMALGSSQDLTSPPGPSRRGGPRGRGRGRGAGRGAAYVGGNGHNVAQGSQGGFNNQNRGPNNAKSRLTLRGGASGVGTPPELMGVKGRLGERGGGGGPIGRRGRGSLRGQGSPRGRGNVRGRGAGNTRGGGSGSTRGGGAGSTRGGGDSRRGAFNRTFDQNTRGGIARGMAARGGLGRGRGAAGRGGQRVFTNSQRGATRGGRGGSRGNQGRGGRGGFRGGRGRGGQGQGTANRSSLDNELDAYMAAANIDDQLLM